MLPYSEEAQRRALDSIRGQRAMQAGPGQGGAPQALNRTAIEQRSGRWDNTGGGTASGGNGSGKKKNGGPMTMVSGGTGKATG